MEIPDALLFSEPCPYLPGRTSVGEMRQEKESFSTYEHLLLLGWRRSGTILYRYRCMDCSQCIPIRIPVSRLSYGKHIKSLLRRNSDIQVSLSAPHFCDEYYSLYEKYISTRHPGGGPLGKESFVSLLDAPIAMVSEYRDSSAKLCALGFIDMLPGGISSVYFAFDPNEGKRSLGSFSIYAEAAIAQKLGRNYYYLGFWVPFASKMDYKADFHPFELALPILKEDDSPDSQPHWVEFSCKEDALDYLSASQHR